MKKVGLIVEGGGFRGIYCAGILDYFLDEKWYFPYVLGISMGACNAANYVSRQRGRSIDVPYEMINDDRYISVKNFFANGNLFGFDFIFNEIPYKQYKYDFDEFRNNNQELVVGAMNVNNGNTTFFKKSKVSDELMMESLKASCSLPYVTQMVTIRGNKYIDGGMSSSIPIKKAFEDGMDKCIVLLTRPKGYKKTKPKFNPGHFAYKEYPNVVKALNMRHLKYNREIEIMEEYEEQGKVLAIYPDEAIDMGRIERNKEKLMKAYNDGFNKAKKLKAKIEEFAFSD